MCVVALYPGLSQNIECGLLPASVSMIELEKLRVAMDRNREDQ